MSYSVRNHAGFVAANYQVNERLGLFANLVVNDGRGSLGGINLDTSTVLGVPPGFDYTAISEIGRYSSLSVGRVQQLYGLNYEFRPKRVLSVTGFHDRYTDRDPYLFDAAGSSAGAHAGISYIF